MEKWNFEQLKQEAQKKKPSYQSLFKKLRKTKPKNLDTTTQALTNIAYKEIDCLQCANCCSTVGPLFTDRDINTISKKLKMSSRDFIEGYLRVDEEQDYVLKSVPCPFLGQDNYCSIYDYRPKACREFPHTDHKKLYIIDRLTIKNSESCPIVQKVLNDLLDAYK